MATTATPNGLRPINLVGGLPFAGSTRSFKIASGYATDIGFGDVVALSTDGVLVKVTNVGTVADPFPAGVVGIFLGVEYTEPSLNYLLHRQNWVAGTVAPDAKAYVCDDPNTLFQVQADAAVAQTALGANIALNQGAVNTVTGNSTISADVATIDVTSGIAFRIVDFVRSTTSTPGDAFTDIIVKFNPVAHSYTSSTGV